MPTEIHALLGEQKTSYDAVAPPTSGASPTVIAQFAEVEEKRLRERRSLVMALVFCLFFMVLELIGGYVSHSLAILTDALHLMTDVGAYALSIFAITAASRAANSTFSYGWHRAEVLGTLISVFTIWALVGAISLEALSRIWSIVECSRVAPHNIASSLLASNNLTAKGGAHTAALATSTPSPVVVPADEVQALTCIAIDSKIMVIVGVLGMVVNMICATILYFGGSHGHTHFGGGKCGGGGDHGHSHDEGGGDHGHDHGHGHGHGEEDDHHDDDDDHHHGHSHSGGGGGCSGGRSPNTKLHSASLDSLNSDEELAREVEEMEAAKAKGDEDEEEEEEEEEELEDVKVGKGKKTSDAGGSHGHSHGHSPCDDHGDDHGHSHGHGHGKGGHGHKKRKSGFAVHAAFLHALGDCVQSLGVILAGVFIYVVNQWQLGTPTSAHSIYNLADPLSSLLFAVITLRMTKRLTYDLLAILMESTPQSIDYHALQEALESIDGVESLHDLHVWSLAADYNALSVHLVANHHNVEVLHEAQRIVEKQFGISHHTIQVDPIEHGSGKCHASGSCAVPMRAEF